MGMSLHGAEPACLLPLPHNPHTKQQTPPRRPMHHAGLPLDASFASDAPSLLLLSFNDSSSSSGGGGSQPAVSSSFINATATVSALSLGNATLPPTLGAILGFSGVSALAVVDSRFDSIIAAVGYDCPERVGCDCAAVVHM